MNEIKECPFCRGGADLTIDVESDCAIATIGCPDCDVIFKFVVTLSRYKTINEAVDSVLNMALEQWNTQPEEPQERKDSNIEWALNEIKKGTFFYNVCNLAHLTKWYVPCVEEDCGECEFRDKKHAINYLLAPHED